MRRPHCCWRAAREMRLPAVWTVQRTVNSVRYIKPSVSRFRSVRGRIFRVASCKRTNLELFANFIVDAMLFPLASNSRRISSDLDLGRRVCSRVQSMCECIKSCSSKRIYLTPCVGNWFTDHNEWPKPCTTSNSSLSFLSELVGTISLDRNYWEAINLLFVSPGL